MSGDTMLLLRSAPAGIQNALDMPPIPLRQTRPAVSGFHHRKGCQCDPGQGERDDPPRRAGVRVSAEGVRCLYCREFVSVPVEEAALNGIRVTAPPAEHGEIRASSAGSPDQAVGGDDTYRLFCNFLEKSQASDPDPAWVEFQRFVQSEKAKGGVTAHAPSQYSSGGIPSAITAAR